MFKSLNIIYLLGIVLLLSMITSGIIVEKTSLEEITKTSQVIVYGKVVNKKSIWEGKQINTYLTLEVFEVLKGKGIADEITIKQMGGRVGPYADEIDGQPYYEVGDEVFFFLVDWKENLWIHSIALGGYSVVRTGGQTYAFNEFNDIIINEPINKKVGEDLKSQYLLSEIISKVRTLSEEN